MPSKDTQQREACLANIAKSFFPECSNSFKSVKSKNKNLQQDNLMTARPDNQKANCQYETGVDLF